MRSKDKKKRVAIPEKKEVVFFTIEELMLISFIVCSVEKKYSLLVKEGEATDQQLDEYWVDLLSKYYEIRGDDSSVAYIAIQKEIWELKIRIDLLNAYMAFLAIRYDAEIAALLQKEGYEHLTFLPETFKDDIHEVVNTEARTVHDILMLQCQLQEMNAGRTDKVSSENFYDTVMTISSVEKVPYSVRTMTTFEYAIACKRLENHINNLKKDNYV